MEDFDAAERREEMKWTRRKKKILRDLQNFSLRPPGRSQHDVGLAPVNCSGSFTNRRVEFRTRYN